MKKLLFIILLFVGLTISLYVFANPNPISIVVKSDTVTIEKKESSVLTKEEKKQLKRAVFEKKGVIYVYNEVDGSVIPIGDQTKSKILPVFSSNYKNIAFAYTKNNGGTYYRKVGIYNTDNKTEKEIEIQNQYINQITYIEWMDNNTIGIEGHINPSTSGFFVIDTSDGKILKQYIGALFTILPDKKSILYRENIPHFSQKTRKESFYIDDSVVYTADNINDRFSYPQISSSSDKIAFVEQNNVVYADLDISNKSISNVMKVDLDNDIKGHMMFDSEDNLVFVSSNTEYKLDINKKNFVKQNREIDKQYAQDIDEKQKKFDESIKRFFKSQEKDDIKSLTWSK